MLVTGISKQGIYFCLHRFIHLDERRPGAFETFAGNFLGRVDVYFARRLIERVGRAFGESLRPATMLSLCGSVLAVSWNSASLVLERWWPSARTFVGLHRVGLLDAHEHEVVEHAFRRQRPAGAESTISGKFIVKIGRNNFTDAQPM